MQHPSELEWIEGDLPDVHTVPYDCRILAWFVYEYREDEARFWVDLHGKPIDHTKYHGKLAKVGMVAPWENDLNPIRWCDSSCFPIGSQMRVTHWAWLNRGTPREDKTESPQ